MKKTSFYIFIVMILLNLVVSGCVKESNAIQRENEPKSIGSDEPKIEEFSDLRQIILKREGKSLKGMDLSNKDDILSKVTFDTHTEWPEKDKLPKEFDPDEIIEIGKDPGLEIRDLHNQGITGKGVKVAIIDQPLLLDHKEYKDKIAKYTPIDVKNVGPQMHGPAVASILVGENCGVAPDASLYFWAEPSWKKDYIQRTTALDEIIEHNKDKSLNERIRVVSVSIGYNYDFDNLSLWIKKIEEAEKEGIIVVHCGDEGDKGFFGIRCELYKDRDNPKNYDIASFADNKSYLESLNLLYVPIDNRTTADFEGKDDYTFWSAGGLSWGAPYLAGVITLGYQVNPNLKQEDIYNYLRETGTPFNGGCIINPKAFVKKINDTI